jgi:hypothetical protein
MLIVQRQPSGVQWPSEMGDNYRMFDVIMVGVIATTLIVGATTMIPIAVWLDYKFRDRVDQLLDRR